MDVNDMNDLLDAIRNSCDSAQEEELIRESKKDTACSSDSKDSPVKRGMERRYINAPERRLPWNLFPIPEQLSLEQRVHVMTAYKEQLNICRYRRAKTSSAFADWNCVFSIPILKNRLNSQSQEFKPGLHHTRSGRTVKGTPHYIDDDDSDTETSISRKCRKKMRKLSNENIIAKSSLFRDIPILNRTNLDLPVDALSDQSENKIFAKPIPITPEKMVTDDVIPEEKIANSLEDSKLRKSPSPEASSSKMMVIAQVHRDCQKIDTIEIVDDENEDEKKISSPMNLLSRKRPKRLKISVDD